MVEDRARTLGYKKAIEAPVTPDPVCLDIGCGVGILSLVRYLRDNYLSGKGTMVPVSYESDLEKSITFWREKKYGIDFSNLEREAMVQHEEKLKVRCWFHLLIPKAFWQKRNWAM